MRRWSAGCRARAGRGIGYPDAGDGGADVRRDLDRDSHPAQNGCRPPKKQKGIRKEGRRQRAGGSGKKAACREP